MSRMLASESRFTRLSRRWVSTVSQTRRVPIASALDCCPTSIARNRSKWQDVISVRRTFSCTLAAHGSYRLPLILSLMFIKLMYLCIWNLLMLCSACILLDIWSSLWLIRFPASSSYFHHLHFHLMRHSCVKVIPLPNFKCVFLNSTCLVFILSVIFAQSWFRPGWCLAFVRVFVLKFQNYVATVSLRHIQSCMHTLGKL